MRETAHTAPTAETNAHDRTTAHGLAVEFRLTIGQSAQIAHALAETREAAFAAGLEERADEAHAAGYAEGLADGIGKGKASGAAASRAVFETLFAGGPDTPCRTTWRPEAGALARGQVATSLTECVELPLDELRAAFDEAERIELTS